MKVIVLAFTLNGQSVKKILEAIQDIKKEYPEAICIHALPIHQMLDKIDEQDVFYNLEENYPYQLNLFNDKSGQPLHKELCSVAVNLKAQVCVIGEVKEGVAEEVELYKAAELPIKYYTLD